MAINFTDAIDIVRDKIVVGSAKVAIGFNKGVDRAAVEALKTGVKVGSAVKTGTTAVGEKVKDAADWVGDQFLQLAAIVLGVILLIALLFGRD